MIIHQNLTEMQSAIHFLSYTFSMARDVTRLDHPQTSQGKYNADNWEAQMGARKASRHLTEQAAAPLQINMGPATYSQSSWVSALLERVSLNPFSLQHQSPAAKLKLQAAVIHLPISVSTYHLAKPRKLPLFNILSLAFQVNPFDEVSTSTSAISPLDQDNFL